jgi:hypothetical protein
VGEGREADERGASTEKVEAGRATPCRASSSSLRGYALKTATLRPQTRPLLLSVEERILAGCERDRERMRTAEAKGEAAAGMGGARRLRDTSG